MKNNNSSKKTHVARLAKKTVESLTELVFILDRSGSMCGLEADTIGGFNSMLTKQKGEKGRAFVSTVLFDNVSEVLHDRVPIENVAQMTGKDYTVRGCTALIDAIGSAIHHIGNIHKYAAAADKPNKTLFVIITDGMENASHMYTAEKVKEMISNQKEKYGWEFLFLGANIDAVSTADKIGINPDRAVTYCCDSEGTQLNYCTINSAISEMRCGCAISPDWKNDIEEDMRKRGNR